MRLYRTKIGSVLSDATVFDKICRLFKGLSYFHVIVEAIIDPSQVLCTGDKGESLSISNAPHIMKTYVLL